jgi:hypothetical protein
VTATRSRDGTRALCGFWYTPKRFDENIIFHAKDSADRGRRVGWRRQIERLACALRTTKSTSNIEQSCSRPDIVGY